ncbi:bile acid:sodium symporter [Streptomyces sp. Ag109_G2-15]|uniref:bile acid:sodium symporter n=1 Tax=Streptomyces sp. Ag109_G2-15 TaxID=1938850 RepID=UPI000BD5AC80|nr:bile acid:sodium symporter [Streptomyces sp. Ag109_G2-15]SOD90382.1 bile acid:Na+ symporter, BASS family [Streptomyces sp. Ag109_G2-15]
MRALFPPSPLLSARRALGLLRRRLGRAVAVMYAAAALLPDPGLWLRHPHSLGFAGLAELRLGIPQFLLALVLFGAGLQVPLRELGLLLRRPAALLAGLALHVLAPLLIVPGVAFALRQSPDQDGGSGMVTAMILVVAMPVAAGATVWTAKGDGDQPTAVGLVLASTLVSPLTVPLTLAALGPLLHGSYAGRLATTASAAGDSFALTSVVLPCALGLLGRLALPEGARDRLLGAVVPAALLGSLLLTYVNASGVLGPFLRHPRPILLAAALAVAATVCGLSFTLGGVTARLLRLDARAGASVTLACGMNNSSASAVLITTALPDRPQILLPVLAYGLLQKVAAGRVVRGAERRPPRDRWPEGGRPGVRRPAREGRSAAPAPPG